MSVSRAQLEDFAKYVATHPALPEFEKRVDAKIFEEFKKATTESKRLEAGYAYDGFTALLGEIHLVVAEMRQAEKQKEDSK